MGKIMDLKRVSICYQIRIREKDDQEIRFTNLKELVSFFHENKRLVEVVGYIIIKNRTPCFNDNLLSGTLAVEWEDAFGYTKKYFNNVYEVAEFFNEYKLISEWVGYAPRSRKV